MIKKHEREKMAAMQEDENQIEDEMEAVWVLPYLRCGVVCSSWPTPLLNLLVWFVLVNGLQEEDNFI